MAKTFSANASDSELVTFLLLEIQWPGGTVRYCNADLDIMTTAGYYPAMSAPFASAYTWDHSHPFAIASIDSTLVDSQASDTITIANADNLFSGVLFTGAQPTGSVVKIYEALFTLANMNVHPDDVKLLLLCRVAALNLPKDDTHRDAGIALAPYYDFNARVQPATKLSLTCTDTFKDPLTCQYAGGDTSCLRTLIACTAKGNQLNYGGFPTLAAMNP
jgi:hypothetical protein